MRNSSGLFIKQYFTKSSILTFFSELIASRIQLKALISC